MNLSDEDYITITDRMQTNLKDLHMDGHQKRNDVFVSFSYYFFSVSPVYYVHRMLLKQANNKGF